MKTIVISAVNLVEAGTLAILNDCLSYLSALAAEKEFRIVAVVYKKELVDFPNVTYIETQWPKKRWVNRLWFEYVSLKKISKELSPVYLWFSLHDVSPSVKAERRAVYCHNSFPFYKWKLQELFFAPKIVMFAVFTKYFYRINMKENSYVVVQQNWFRAAMIQMFSLNFQQVIVAPPSSKIIEKSASSKHEDSSKTYDFVFAASPNSHKNFECICQAVEHLEKELGISNFKVFITITGTENQYTKWIFKHWGNRFNSLQFIGFLNRMALETYYANCNCLIFPSKVETWGLPITEFSKYQKPMLLADLPYAHETAAGAEKVAFFDPENAKQLANLMAALIRGDETVVKAEKKKVILAPVANNWAELFNCLLT